MLTVQDLASMEIKHHSKWNNQWFVFLVVFQSPAFILTAGTKNLLYGTIQMGEVLSPSKLPGSYF